MSLTEAGLFTWLSGSNNYETEKLNADVEAIRSYYLNRGYVNVDVSEPQVELSENLEDVFITITVNEGSEFRVGSVNVGGDQPIDLSSTFEEMTLQTGEIFSRRLVNEAVSTMSEKLGDAGYARAQAGAVPEINNESQTVDVTLVVTPGPLVYVRRVEFRGNTNTSDVVLRREIPQLEASVSSAAAIEKGRINLQRLGFFSLVRALTRPVPDRPDQVDVVYEVKEQASGSLSASVGFSQGEGVLLGAAAKSEKFPWFRECTVIQSSGARVQPKRRAFRTQIPTTPLMGSVEEWISSLRRLILTIRVLQTIRQTKPASD